MKKIMKTFAILFIIALLMTGVSIVGTESTTVSAATKVKLNKRKLRLLLVKH